MRLSVIGAGYVGLVSGLCLAEKGIEVVCVDVDEARIDAIKRGNCPIYEKGLDELLTRNINKTFEATTDIELAVKTSDVTIIAVGTPFDGNQIDLQYIEQASEQIGRALATKDGYHLVVVKSTVVPGTTENVVLPRIERYSDKKLGVDFGLGMNPEFLREGEAVQDFMFPDRIVLGGYDEKSHKVLADIYAPFQDVDQLFVDIKSAELTKYTANCLLATLISFSNEIANVAASIGVDAREVMHGVHLDKRFTPLLENNHRIYPSFITYLEAGCGFGGSCFPKDVKAFISFASKTENPTKLLDAVIEINEAQPFKVIELVKRHFPSLAGVKTAVLGIAFKPGTNDIRESPSLKITDVLLKEKALVTAYDPVAEAEASVYFSGKVPFAKTLAEALEDTQVVIILTRWEEFGNVPELISHNPDPPLVVDGRRMLDKDSVPKYEGIGL